MREERERPRVIEEESQCGGILFIVGWISSVHLIERPRLRWRLNWAADFDIWAELWLCWPVSLKVFSFYFQFGSFAVIIIFDFYPTIYIVLIIFTQTRLPKRCFSGVFMNFVSNFLFSKVYVIFYMVP